MTIRFPTKKMHLELKNRAANLGSETKRRDVTKARRRGYQRGLERNKMQVREVKE